MTIAIFCYQQNKFILFFCRILIYKRYFEIAVINHRFLSFFYQLQKFLRINYNKLRFFCDCLFFHFFDHTVLILILRIVSFITNYQNCCLYVKISRDFVFAHFPAIFRLAFVYHTMINYLSNCSA